MTIHAHRAVPNGDSRDRAPGGEIEMTVVGSPTLVDSIVGLVEMLSERPGESFTVTLLDAVKAVVRVSRQDEMLVAALMPDRVATPSHVVQLQRNATARTAALDEFGAFSAAGLAEARGAAPTNPHATAGRWLRAGEIFAVESGKGRLFPAFQFLDGRPKAAVARIIASLPSGMTGWETLLWFTGSDGHLDGRRPVDVLDHEPDRVVEAAAYLTSTIAD